MDESVINGANLFFPDQLGIPQKGDNASNNQWLLGLVNGAPYVRICVLRVLVWNAGLTGGSFDSSAVVLSAAGFPRL